MKAIHRALDRLFGTAEEINGAGRCPTYLYRWHLFEVGPVKVYLHRFVGSDWSRDLHDHPKRFVTVGLCGSYIEDTPNHRHLYRSPWLRSFPASHRHRIITYSDCWTLVLVGPAQREWGFWNANRFVHWKEYVRGPLGDEMKACP